MRQQESLRLAHERIFHSSNTANQASQTCSFETNELKLECIRGWHTWNGVPSLKYTTPLTEATQYLQREVVSVSFMSTPSVFMSKLLVYWPTPFPLARIKSIRISQVIFIYRSLLICWFRRKQAFDPFLDILKDRREGNQVWINVCELFMSLWVLRWVEHLVFAVCRLVWERGCWGCAVKTMVATRWIRAVESTVSVDRWDNWVAEMLWGFSFVTVVLDRWSRRGTKTRVKRNTLSSYWDW